MPIETCFAMVKRFIRDNEIEASLAPIRFINSAFQRCAIGGSHAHTVYNHFKGYFENYNQYNVEMNNLFP